jgi:hypothetical protein
MALVSVAPEYDWHAEVESLKNGVKERMSVG